ncbi:acylphosphatase [Streptococcus gordonii]|nr:acylphosphatase [Streptococcus gordonii]MCG4822862.1 acylphosphatase [Streptococcus gordonii]MCG4848150.1 acylphosphatase [Streptococcus gordonii]MDE8686062.1 acylphosphatase [Streptococcus gordonii]
MDNKKTTLSENIGTKMSNEDYVKVLDERLDNFQSLKIKRFS